jgi:FixJ family two-component response regulator
MNLDSIAVVDDDEDYRELLSAVLDMQCGVRTVPFAGGRDFVHAVSGQAAADRPQLVLVDFHMPGMSGLDVLRSMSERELRLPIVLISHAATPQECDACMAAGALGFLQKPTRVQDLPRALEGLLRGAGWPPAASAMEQQLENRP